MDTVVIIVLGALILIVVIAIIVILIKGKDPAESSEDESMPEDSGKTFKEINTPEETGNLTKPDLSSPQLHQKEEVTPQPTPQSPAMNNLTTPQQTPSAQVVAQPKNEELSTPKENPLIQPNQQTSNSSVGQDQGMYKPNPLPNSSQIDSDMANLDNSKSEVEKLASNVNNAVNSSEGGNTQSQAQPAINTPQPGQALPTPPTPPPPPKPTPTVPSQTPPAPPETEIPKPPVPITPENPNSPIHTPPQDNPVNP